MTLDDAQALHRFIKDHDTRFEPVVVTDDGGEAIIRLTSLSDRAELQSVRSFREYGTLYMDGAAPGFTIREAWRKWMADQES